MRAGSCSGHLLGALALCAAVPAAGVETRVLRSSLPAASVRFAGEQRVAEVVANADRRPMGELCGELLAAARAFGDGSPQTDDITLLILHRLPE